MAKHTQREENRIQSERDIKRVKARLDKAKSERTYFEPLLEECHRLYMPHRRRFYTKHNGGDQAADIYDETGVNALHEYASRIHAGVTPNFTKFAVLTAGPDVHDSDKEAVNRDLEEITDYLFEEVWQSNFSQEAHESHLDMGISTGSLLIEEGTDDLFHVTSLPMTELYLEAGPRDEIGGMFREREIQARHLPALYPRQDFPESVAKCINDEADKPLRVVDAIWTDFTAPDHAAFSISFTTDADHDGGWNFKRMTGRGCNPYIGYRYGKAAGEVWGRGPAMNTLPAVRTMNLTIEMLLQNAAMSLVGMYHVDDDSIINEDTITLEPGAILPRMAGSRGLERIDTGSGDFRLSDILLQDQAMKIRRGLYNDMLSDPNKTPATAFEVAERMADLSHRMAAAFGRLHYELLRPLMARIVYIAEKRGRIEMPTLRGQRVQVSAVSPLALAQGQRDIQNVMQYHQLTTAIMGPQAALSQYDNAELLPYLREKMNVDKKLFATPEQMQQTMEALMASQMVGAPAPEGAPPGPLQGM